MITYIPYSMLMVYPSAEQRESLQTPFNVQVSIGIMLIDLAYKLKENLGYLSSFKVFTDKYFNSTFRCFENQ